MTEPALKTSMVNCFHWECSVLWLIFVSVKESNMNVENYDS
jgi:hypothetical protein